MAYDFLSLSHREFENLTRDLVGRELGVRFEAFSEGPDDGMDGRFWVGDSTIILQAKHYGRSRFSTLKSKLTKERLTIDRLAPSRYILATSASLTPGNKSALGDVIGPALHGPGDIFGPDDLNALLRKYPDIELAHQQLWAASTAVLRTVVTDAVEEAGKRPNLPPQFADVLRIARAEVHAKISSAHLALKYDPSVYVKRLVEDDIESWLSTPRSKTSTCFLVLAPAGSGKTNLLCRVANASSLRRPTILLIGSQLRLDGEFGIWTQVLAACGSRASADQSRADQVGLVQQVARNSPEGLVIVLDAINEYTDPVALKRELSTFLVECEQAGVHLLVSCRDYYWGLFDAEWWKTFVRAHRDEQKSTKRTLGNFAPQEADGAFKLYFQHYGVSAQPQGNALEQFRHPLLLRFFCETYRGETLGRLRDVRLKDLFDTYWERKLGSIAERMIDQGTVGVLPELTRHVGQCILDISAHMLSQTVRAIPVSTAQRLAQSDALPSQLSAPYGRILDEHIVLEELDPWGTTESSQVAFVFEEFMEYAMARAMLGQWHRADVDEICAGVVAITERYDDFSQVLGVVLYLALMLKEKRDIALWSTLIDKGAQWEKVIIEAFKRLPENQIDDGVFAALIELLRAPNASTRIEALELLKFGRLRRIPTPALIAAVGDLVTSDDLRIRRRALLALGFCPAAFAIPLIEKAITTPMRKRTHAYEVVKNAATALVNLNTPDALPVVVLIFGGFWHGDNIAGIVGSFVRANLPAVYDMLGSDDILLRIGATKILGEIPRREHLAKLGERIAALRAYPPTWSYKDLPDWVGADGSFYLFSPFNIGGRPSEHQEIESVASVILKLESSIHWNERSLAFHRLVDELIADPNSERLREAIPSLDYDSNATIKMLQSGLERRDPGRWKVRRGYWEIKISPRRRSAELSDTDRRDLAALLGLEERRVWREGAHVSTGMRSNNFWREYIYRCWGWEPAILGYLDSD